MMYSFHDKVAFYIDSSCCGPGRCESHLKGIFLFMAENCMDMKGTYNVPSEVKLLKMLGGKSSNLLNGINLQKKNTV